MVGLASAPRYSLAPLDSEPGRSVLLSDGVSTGTCVPGCVLEAAFDDGERVLLFTTLDVPFEETLDIVLLGANGRIIDRAWIGVAMTTGNFRDARVEGMAVTFGFLGLRPWRVRLLAHPKWLFPLTEPWSVHRTGLARRHFVLELR